MPTTKDDILRKIPMYHRRDVLVPRAAFKDYYRMLHSYVYSEAELRMIDAQVVALIEEGDFAETKYRKYE